MKPVWTDNVLKELRKDCLTATSFIPLSRKYNCDFRTLNTIASTNKMYRPNMKHGGDRRSAKFRGEL